MWVTVRDKSNDVTVTYQIEYAEHKALVVHEEGPGVILPMTEAEKRQARFAKKSRTYFARLVLRDGPFCKACGTTDNLCVDHIIPMSRGGSDDMDNLQLLCRRCNSRKGAR